MTQINSNFAGQNAWMPATLPTPCNTNLNGQLDKHWEEIKQSKASTIRFGGIAYDRCLKTAADFGIFQTNGRFHYDFTPIIQLSYYDPDPPDPGGPTIYTNPKKAARHLLKHVVRPLYKRGVKNFSIGNEPNLEYTTANERGNNQNQALGIYEYISEISKAIRAEFDDVVLYGPELTHYDEVLIDKLTGKNMDSGDCNILPCIDVFTFHFYPLGNEDDTDNDDQIEPSRENIIHVLREAAPENQVNTVYKRDGTTAVISLEERLSGLNETIVEYNTNHATDIKIAITEANICYQNNRSDIGKEGHGANGFIAGQFWAELMAVAMSQSVYTIAFWSVIEGGAGTGYISDIGYISSQPANVSSAIDNFRKSTYYHFTMMAKYFRGDFQWCVITNATGNRIKAFASKNEEGGVAVLVMNQNEVPETLDIEIRLNSGNFQNPGYVGIRANFTINNDPYTDVIHDQETLLFLFNPISGRLKKRYAYNIEDYRNDVDPFLPVEEPLPPGS